MEWFCVLLNQCQHPTPRPYKNEWKMLFLNTIKHITLPQDSVEDYKSSYSIAYVWINIETYKPLKQTTFKESTLLLK